MLDTLTLRLTTNVTVSPASSARSSSAAARMSSTTSGRRSANSAVIWVTDSGAPSRALDRLGDQILADRALVATTRSPARNEAPVLRLDHVQHTLRHPLGVDVL